MRYISITLLCAAVLFTGINAAVERRKRIRVFERLSAFFSLLAENSEKGGCGFLALLEQIGSQERFDIFTFSEDTLRSASDGLGLAQSWQNAVAADKLLMRTGTENVRAVRDLSLYFCESAPRVFAEACMVLADRFAEEKRLTAARNENDERLLLTGSLLGAAAIFLILI